MILKNAPSITKEFILSRISEEDIFRYYVPHLVEFGKNFKSELYSDTKPSCSIKRFSNGLLYKDFGTGDVYDCFGYVQAKFHCNFQECLKIIACDFNLIKITAYIPTNIAFGIPSKEKVTVVETEIKIRSHKFERKDLAYWNSYGVTNEFLALEKIKAISYYWINGNRFKAENYSYAYIGGNYKYKIYQPFSEYKWFGNLNKTILGYDILPKTGDILFITSSFKDVGCLYGSGYSAIDLGSETSNISQLTLDFLKERFKRVVLYYDNDETGIALAETKAKEWSIEFIHNPIGEPKDPSDYYKKYGREKLNELIKSLI